jgi:hypothetical protein
VGSVALATITKTTEKNMSFKNSSTLAIIKKNSIRKKKKIHFSLLLLLRSRLFFCDDASQTGVSRRFSASLCIREGLKKYSHSFPSRGNINRAGPVGNHHYDHYDHYDHYNQLPVRRLEQEQEQGQEGVTWLN